MSTELATLRDAVNFSNSLEESYRVILKKSPIYFHLYLAANGDGDKSSEEHLKNSKTTRDAYLGLVQFIHVKNSSIYLVTQSH